MSIECGECERDLRGGHADDCSAAFKCQKCGTVVSHTNITPDDYRAGIERKCVCGAEKVEELT